MPFLEISDEQYLELEKISLGAFYPLNGFMVAEDFECVVENMRLRDGSIFPLPVSLAADGIENLIEVGDELELRHRGKVCGIVNVESKFSCDKDAVAKKLFSTNDMRHPGVAHWHAVGKTLVGGAVKLLSPSKFSFSRYELTPKQTREIFKNRGWKTVAGFQTRNVPHKAHEYLQRLALEYVDGVFVQPLVGRKKNGDYTPEAIIKGYQSLINRFLPSQHMLLGVLSTSMRYAGPREAVFHAIIRKNYGCTHFIVGRDHAGVDDFYSKYAAQDLVMTLAEEIGIKILPFKGPFYCSTCGGIATEKTCGHLDKNPSCVFDISGTMIRRLFSQSESPDIRFMRPEIISDLSGVTLFIEEEPK